MDRHHIRFVALPAALVVLLAAATAGADGAGGTQAPPTASELPPGPVKRMILDVQKQVRDDKHAPELVDEPVEEALRAAERARGARAAGDARHGAMLAKLAQQWAEVAQAVLRAATVEAAARAEAARLREATMKVERAETLLSEQQARLGRLQKQVEQAEARAKAARGEVVAAERERTEPSAPRASKRKTP